MLLGELVVSPLRVPQKNQHATNPYYRFKMVKSCLIDSIERAREAL